MFMKKVVFGVFAHPDDEAFLPSGTLIRYVTAGADLHLICATRGEQGQNPDKVADLGKLRENEWLKSGKLMGASSQKQLGYPDGALSNNLFTQISKDIYSQTIKVIKSYSEPVEIIFVTYDNCGVTGHLDHIAISFVTTQVYCQLKETLSSHSFGALRYACLCEAGAPKNDTSFVFMPKGQAHNCIDETEDVSDVLERKKQVMRAHHSQRRDAEIIITRLGSNLAYEHFCLFTD